MKDMSEYSRRRFLAQAAIAGASLSSSAWGRDPLQKSNLGVELYTVRNIITKDPNGVLKSIADIGYSDVEVVYATLHQIWPGIQACGLKPVSAHVDAALWNAGGDPLDKALAGLKEQGFQYAVYPYVDPKLRGGADVMKRLAQTLNQSGKASKKHDLTFCYHNHAFEFQPLGDTTGLQIFMSETDPATVGLELDIFWVSVAGHDPVDLLKTYTGRIPLLHLKDKAKGLPTQFNEKVPPSTFKEVGNGSIDIPAVLKAADAEGVKYYFVEQDQTPGDPIASLRESYEYLSKHFST
jgi:sugar phosphate isomerase/epimerase